MIKDLTRTAMGAGLFAMLISTPAYAALISCPASFTTDGTSKVSNAAGTQTAANACQYLDPADNSNVASVDNINDAGFFGVDTWEANPGANQLQVDANSATGTWTIAGVNFALYDYAIVFKDGQDTNLIAFAFNEEFSSGAWSTPFTEPPFVFSGASLAHDVSHYTIVRTDEVCPDCTPTPNLVVPEPASIAALGSGLVALAGVLGWRRRRHETNESALAA